MNAATIIFYLIAMLIVGGGIIAVTSPRIFRAAVFLLFSLLGVAGLYFYLEFEFLGAVQISVYVGGIVVLIIFSIFLTQGSDANLKTAGWKQKLFSGLAAVSGAVGIIFLFCSHTFQAAMNPAIEPSVKNIGRQMLSTTRYGFLLPFEVVSILLLGAMVGCIVIAIKSKPNA